MKNINLLILTLASASSVWATDINISSGQLEKLISNKGLDNVVELKLTGTMDARDFAAIENLPEGIETLDLSEVTVQPLTLTTKKYFGRTLFPEGELPGYTFFKSKVKKLILPAQLSKIGAGAFAGSSITEMVIPEGVKEIGDYAFYGCTDLEKIELPSTLSAIGKGTFGNCMNLTTVNLPSGIREIPERAFAGDLRLETITFAGNVSKVGREAFSHTSISKLDLSNVQDFEAYALSGMPYLEYVNINSSANIAEGLLMDNISLASLGGMPENVPDYFAANCTNLPVQNVIANTITVGKYAFANQQAPQELVLAPGLAKIDRGAFSGLTGLNRIDASALEGNIPEVNDNTFEGIDQPNIVLYVTDDSLNDWKEHPVWSLFDIQSESTTSVENITSADDNINILFRGNLLSVNGPENFVDISVYTTDGRLAYSTNPNSNNVEIQLSELPSGVVIVVATDAAGNSKKASLMLR